MTAPPDHIEDERPEMPEQNTPQRPLSTMTMWTVIASIAGALGSGIVLGNLIYSNGNTAGELAAVQAQHTVQITQMQTQITGQQTILYSINDNLARLTQKISDMNNAHSKP